MSHTDLEQDLIHEIYLSLPMPEENLYEKFIEIIQANLFSRELLDADLQAQSDLWEKIMLANYDKIQESQERFISSRIPKIKEIIDDKRSSNLDNALHQIAVKILEIVEFLQNDITNYIRLDGNDETQANIIAWSKSMTTTLKSTVYEDLKASKNKIISKYMKNIIKQFPVILENYINLTNKNTREHLDCYQGCQELFENYIHIQYSFTPKFVEELFSEDLEDFLDKMIDGLMTKETDQYLKEYKEQISDWKYYTNSEARESRKEAIIDFKVSLNQKFGWIPSEIMKETVFNLNKMMCKAWKTNSIQHKKYAKEIDTFTNEILEDMINGSLKPFDSSYCIDFSLIAYFLCSSALETDNPEDILIKINEITQLLNNHFDYNAIDELLKHQWIAHIDDQIEARKTMSQIWLNSSLHDKKHRYFFLFCITLVSSNLHYFVCPQLKTYGVRESNIRDFDWLRNTLKLVFQTKDFTSFSLNRQDNPIFTCQMMMKIIVKYLVKSHKLPNDSAYQIFTNYIDGYVAEITSKHNLIGLSKTIKDNFIRIKQENSETVTVCVSGFLSEDSNKDTDWLDLIELNEQGDTYDYKWMSGSVLKLILEICCNLMSWTKFTANKERKRHPHISHWKRVKEYLSRRSENAFFKLSSYINPIIGCPFSKKMTESQKAGQKLAEIIKQNAFNGSMINLVAFSLGCNVVYHCLLELSECDRKIINNVILMGGASNISGDWKRCRKAVGGRMINAYSRHDGSLKYLYRASELSNPIGLAAIDVEGIENCDLSQFIFYHMDYRKMMDLVLYEINYDGD
ncbi:unnamed protein product [Blepharisma stoltei]|uniref:DUF726 domain-containing protein n=1 Tax=Blepharisma stoltei TaxID=1481888 RepID=A0AAU9KDM4_9CILI|nr:unnamed protein product [Blepharisma stoltei]